MIAAAAAKPDRKPRKRAATLPPDESGRMKLVEVQVLVLVHGWTLDAAVELTAADPVSAAVTVSTRGRGRLPYVPTPQMVADEARRLRRFPIGRGED